VQIGIARVFHKSNSFARNSTGLDKFNDHEWLLKDEINRRYAGTSTAIGGVLDELEGSNGVAIPLMATSAPAGGPIDSPTLKTLTHELTSKVAAATESLNGLILELSGAMSTTDAQSADEYILRSIREVLPDRPIALIVSHQANLTPGIAQHCNAIIAIEPVPLANAIQAGREAVHAIGKLSESPDLQHPTVHHLPMLIPVPAQRADVEPLRSYLEKLNGYRGEIGSCSSVALLTGYPYADVSFSGASIVSNPIFSNQKEVATDLVRELWSHRSRFFVDASNVEEAVHHAMATKEGPVLIADLGDNPDDGAPGDGTTVLWALIDLGVRNATVGAIADEQAVEACVRAGVDAKVEIPVGGRKDTRHGYPIDIRGRVTSIHDGSFALSGPINRGVRVDAGKIVVLDVEARHDGHVELILTEKPVQITDPGMFEHIGIELNERAIVSIKSAIDYRPAFEPIATKIFEVITPGITTPDPAFYAYQNVRRPIFPLDAMEDDL
jgi:microcystin degradation protein MlrC